MSETVCIGMIGLGTVGSGVWKILEERASLLEERTGLKLKLKKILVRDKGKKREVSVPASVLTTNPADLFKDPEIRVIVELIGGMEPAANYLRQALESKRPVVTANKELLAKCGVELFSLADKQGVSIGYEASVAGGIPIIRAMREGYVGNQIYEIYGIINGTSNYILTQMTEEGEDFEEALRQAQDKGYAERDPRMDVEGEDAAQKLSLLISLAFGIPPATDKIYTEGISRITPFDIASARELGFVIKLLAIAKKKGEGIEARVHPTLIAKSHPLADVSGVYNAVYLKGDAIGEAMFYGRGAGQMPTASAVVSDIVEAARQTQRAPSITQELPIGSMNDLLAEYYFRFTVIDRPGVLAQIANCLGQHNISIASVHQKEQGKGAKVPILVRTHEARESDVRRAVEKIDRLETVVDRTMLIRIEPL